MIYQLVELHMVYPGETVVVVIVLAMIPYIILRAAVALLIRKKGRRP